MPLLLLWVAATVAIWIVVISGVRQQHPDKNGSSLEVAGAVIVFGAVPPTLICLVSVFVLAQAAPTVQFNAGSSYAMDLWSFWVDAWLPLFCTSGFLAIAYLVSTAIGFAVKRLHWANYALLCAFISASLGWFLLRIAFPSA